MPKPTDGLYNTTSTPERNMVYTYPAPSHLSKTKQALVDVLIHGNHTRHNNITGLSELPDAQISFTNETARKATEQHISNNFTVTAKETGELTPGIQDFTVSSKASQEVKDVQSRTCHYIDAEWDKALETYYNDADAITDIERLTAKKTAWKEALEHADDPSHPIHDWPLIEAAHITMHRDVRSFDKDYNPITTPQRPFSVFSCPTISLEDDSLLAKHYGTKANYHTRSFKHSFKNPLVLEEFLTHSFNFQLKTMHDSGVKIPVISDSSSFIEHGCSPKIVAKAWKKALDAAEEYNFDAIAFAFPNQQAIEPYNKAFTSGLGHYSNPELPILMLEADPIDVTATLANNGINAGVSLPTPIDAPIGRNWNNQNRTYTIELPSEDGKTKKNVSVKESGNAGYPETYALRLRNYVIAQHPVFNHVAAHIDNINFTTAADEAELSDSIIEDILDTKGHDIKDIYNSPLDRLAYEAVTFELLPTNAGRLSEEEAYNAEKIPTISLSDKGLLIEFPTDSFSKRNVHHYSRFLDEKKHIKHNVIDENTLLITTPAAIIDFIKMPNQPLRTPPILDRGDVFAIKQDVKDVVWEALATEAISTEFAHNMLEQAERLQRINDVRVYRQIPAPNYTTPSNSDKNKKHLTATTKASLVVNFMNMSGETQTIMLCDDDGKLTLPSGHFQEGDRSLKETALRSAQQLAGILDAGYALGIHNLRMNEDNLYQVAEITHKDGTYETSYSMTLGQLTDSEIQKLTETVERNNPDGTTVQVVDPYNLILNNDGGINRNKTNSSRRRSIIDVINPDSGVASDVFTSISLCNVLDTHEQIYDIVHQHFDTKIPFQPRRANEPRSFNSVTLRGLGGEGKNERIDLHNIVHHKIDRVAHILHTPKEARERPSWWKTQDEDIKDDVEKEEAHVSFIENEEDKEVAASAIDDESEQSLSGEEENIMVDNIITEPKNNNAPQAIKHEASLKLLLQNNSLPRPSIIRYTFPSLCSSTLAMDEDTVFLYKNFSEPQPQDPMAAFSNTIGITTHTRPGHPLVQDMSELKIKEILKRDFEKAHFCLEHNQHVVVPTFDNGEISLGMDSAGFEAFPALKNFMEKQLKQLDHHAEIVRERTAPTLSHADTMDLLHEHGYGHTLEEAVKHFTGVKTAPHITMVKGHNLEIDFKGTQSFGFATAKQAEKYCEKAEEILKNHGVEITHIANEPHKLLVTKPEGFIRFNMGLGLGFYKQISEEIKHTQAIEKDERFVAMMEQNALRKDHEVLEDPAPQEDKKSFREQTRAKGEAASPSRLRG